jgi:UDP-N-acetylmuramoyl-L-alanyl-D-glutamate--2,6-diaminopimelate ligase
MGRGKARSWTTPVIYDQLMRLSELTDAARRPDNDPEVTGLSEDSRRILPGIVFVAVPGTIEDGHAYIGDAIARGAAAIVGERDGDVGRAVPFVHVESARRALAAMAARFYGEPARRLTVIGFTGTFGKTSTGEVLRALLSAHGMHPGVLGSLGARYDGFHDHGTGLTTPAPVELHRALEGLRNAGADSVIVEVTSHALRMGRVDGVTLSGGLIAAILPGEHTDFHHSFRDYVEAKRLFLDYLAPGAVLAFDADNAPARELATSAPGVAPAGFTLEDRDRALQLRDIALDHLGAHFTVDGQAFQSALLGRGHLRNVALALAYAAAAGLPLKRAADVLPNLVPLRRRMESYEAHGRTVLDDTAAHPESLRATFEVAALLAARPGAGTVVAAYAVRGNRGVEINQQNASELAALSAGYRIAKLIVTASADVAGPNDRASAAEIDATRRILRDARCEAEWHDRLGTAMRAVLDATHSGDLIVLLGAQGMNEGRRSLVCDP